MITHECQQKRLGNCQHLARRSFPVGRSYVFNVFFIWGLAIFIRDSGNPEKKEEGRNKMVWGIITLFVIVSLWGIVAFIGRTFGISPNQSLPIPQVKVYH